MALRLILAALAATLLAVVAAAVAAAQPPRVPACSKSTYHLVGPEPSAGSAASGVTQVVDPISYYQVFGYTAAEIRAQLNSCHPSAGSGRGDYDGYTSWRLNWRIAWDASCRVTRASVVVHVGTALPLWKGTPLAKPGVAARWRSFAAALATHEHGHASLALQYAQEAVSRLQALPGGDCGGLLSSAQSAFNAELSALNTAEAAYDAQTRHGATQGATFP